MRARQREAGEGGLTSEVGSPLTRALRRDLSPPGRGESNLVLAMRCIRVLLSTTKLRSDQGRPVESVSWTKRLFSTRPRQKRRRRNAGRRIVLMPARKRRAVRATRRERLAPPPACGRARLPAFHDGSRQRDFRPEGSASGQASRKRRQTLRTCRRRRFGYSDAPRAPVVMPAGMIPEPPGCGPYPSARGRRTRSAVREYPP